MYMYIYTFCYDFEVTAYTTIVQVIILKWDNYSVLATLIT